MVRTPDKTMRFADSKSNNSITKKSYISEKNILKYKKVLRRLDINGKSSCLITLKKHKGNFQNNPSVPLINPAKIEIGKFSKVIVEAINKELRQKLNMNQ